MDCLHFFYTSRATYAMNENGIYFDRLAFLNFLRNFFCRHPENHTNVDTNLDSRTYFSCSLILYLVLVSCFSFSEGRGNYCETHNFEKVYESVLKARDLKKHITRLRHMPNCNVHLHEKMMLLKFPKSYLTLHGIVS